MVCCVMHSGAGVCNTSGFNQGHALQCLACGWVTTKLKPQAGVAVGFCQCMPVAWRYQAPPACACWPAVVLGCLWCTLQLGTRTGGGLGPLALVMHWMQVACMAWFGHIVGGGGTHTIHHSCCCCCCCNSTISSALVIQRGLCLGERHCQISCALQGALALDGRIQSAADCCTH